MDANAIIERLKKIDRRPIEESERPMIDAWIRQAEEAEALRAAMGNFALKERIDAYRGEVEGFRKKLLEVRGLSQLERLNIMDKIELYNRFIQSFDADAQLAALERTIDNALSRL